MQKLHRSQPAAPLIEAECKLKPPIKEISVISDEEVTHTQQAQPNASCEVREETADCIPPGASVVEGGINIAQEDAVDGVVDDGAIGGCDNGNVVVAGDSCDGVVGDGDVCKNVDVGAQALSTPQDTNADKLFSVMESTLHSLGYQATSRGELLHLLINHLKGEHPSSTVAPAFPSPTYYGHRSDDIVPATPTRSVQHEQSSPVSITDPEDCPQHAANEDHSAVRRRSISSSSSSSLHSSHSGSASPVPPPSSSSPSAEQAQSSKFCVNVVHWGVSLPSEQQGRCQKVYPDEHMYFKNGNGRLFWLEKSYNAVYLQCSNKSCRGSAMCSAIGEDPFFMLRSCHSHPPPSRYTEMLDPKNKEAIITWMKSGASNRDIFKFSFQSWGIKHNKNGSTRCDAPRVAYLRRTIAAKRDQAGELAELRSLPYVCGISINPCCYSICTAATKDFMTAKGSGLDAKMNQVVVVDGMHNALQRHQVLGIFCPSTDLQICMWSLLSSLWLI